MTEFTFVNKNSLIPVVINNITKQKALTMIMEQAFNQNNEYCKNIYWVYAIVIKDTCLKSAKEAMNSLSELKIGTRPFFYPMHRQPVFNEMGLFLDSSLPNSEKLYEKGFYIPSGMALTKEQMIEVSVALHKVFS